MKIRTKVYAILAAAVVFTGVALTFLSGERVMLAEQANIRICLVLERDTFHTGQEIRASVLFKNFSENSSYLNKPPHIHTDETSLKFEIVGPDGTEPKELFLISIHEEPLGKHDFHLLETGAVFETERRLNLYYEIETLGAYVVSARYHNSNDGEKFSRPAWTGTVVSPEVTFEIVP